LIGLVLRTDYVSTDEVKGPRRAAEICLQCGVCCVVKHSCHAQYGLQFTPNHTYVYDCLGAEEPAKNPNLWLCVSCHKCEEVCPYEVSPIRFIEAMKAEAFRNGSVHQVILDEVNQIVTTGYAFPLTGASERQRANLGLGPFSNQAAAELAVIVRRSGLADKRGEEKP
jgi:heterodisulfide reductase subunit C